MRSLPIGTRPAAAALLAALLAVPCSASTGDTTVVEAEGAAAVVNDDVPTARDEAILVAKKRAAEEHAGAYLTARTRVESGMVLSQHIEQEVAAFVPRYVLTGERRDGQIYRVHIQANVVTGEAMQKELVKLAHKTHNVAIRIEESNLDRPAKASYVGGALAEGFLRAGYRVVDQDQLEELRSEWERLRDAGDPDAARRLASGLLVEYFITGHAASRESKNPWDAMEVKEEDRIPFARARASVRVIDTATARVACQRDEDMDRGVAASSLEEAGRAALKEVATRVADAILMGDCIPEAVREIVVEVEGLPGYTDYQRFANFLEALRFVGEAQGGGFRAGGTSVFRAVYGEEVSFLAQRIDRDPRYRVVEVSARRIVVRYAGEEKP